MSEKLKFPNNIAPTWAKLLGEEKDKDYFKNLTRFLNHEYKSGKTIYPSRENILRALKETDYNDVRVVIIGQDPYHGDGQAMGRSFAVPNDLLPKPPSLLNIFKEIESDLNIKMDPSQSDLSAWVKQGVFLLNTVLSVRAGEAFSHRDKGWEVFTKQIIQHLNKREQGIVFLLWGNPAKKIKDVITSPQHKILEAAHPSPLSAHRGFFGSKHFSKCNQLLKSMKAPEINWALRSQSTSL